MDHAVGPDHDDQVYVGTVQSHQHHRGGEVQRYFTTPAPYTLGSYGPYGAVVDHPWTAAGVHSLLWQKLTQQLINISNVVFFLEQQYCMLNWQIVPDAVHELVQEDLL